MKLYNRGAVRLRCGLLGSAGVVALLAAYPAIAQTAPAASAVQEIVVTGTLVRGIAPTGSDIVTVGQKTLQETGAQNVVQLLSTIPQLGQFNTVAQSPIQNSTLSTGRSSFRANVRNLPFGTVSPLLILVDGHDIAGAGVQQTDPDPGVIPTAAIERVEVVLDGGSSLYGANAVGGVLNFITRTHFKGTEVNVTAGGSTPHYHSWNVDLTTGKDWNGGGGVLSVFMRENSALPTSDLPWPRQDLRAYGFSDFRIRTCSPGNVIVGSTTFALNGSGGIGAPGTLNLCDNFLAQDAASAERQWGGYASVSQALTSDIDFNIKAYGSARTTSPRNLPPAEGSAFITPANPFFIPLPGAGATRQSLNFNYAPVYGDHLTAQAQLQSFDVTSTLTWRIGHGWRAIGLLEYGRSNTRVLSPAVNTAASAAALNGPGLTTATALNPYDLTKTNPAVIANILNWRTDAANVQSLVTGRATADGDLFAVPGGQVKAAFGAQIEHQMIDGYQVTGPYGSMAGARLGVNSRNVWAVFGQFNIPVVGSANALPFVQAFNIDVSARYDHYDDVGGTTNPRIGGTWTVVDGLKLRGNWSTAFTAPTVVDETKAGSLDTSVQVVGTGVQGTALIPGDPPSLAVNPSLVLNGALAGAQGPQTAKIWSVGIDINPPKLSGFKASLSYWRVDMAKVLANGCPGNPVQQFATGRIDCDLYRPTLAQLNAALPANVPIQGASSLAALYAAGTPPYELISRIRQNGGLNQNAGVDYDVSYRHTLDWGALYARVNGTYYIQRRSQAAGSTVFVNGLPGTPTLQAIGTLGVDVGEKFTANVRFNYQNAYTVLTIPGRSSLPAFTTTDLYVRYQIDPTMQATLNINNLMAIYPVISNVNGGVNISGAINTQSSLGRYISVSLKKRF
jgi:iron complex outermembrane receptor protein